MSDLVNPKETPFSSESAEVSSKGEIPVVNEGAYKNLVAQIDSILAHSNERSMPSRDRYYEATKRFCKFLADNYRLQKFKNVEERHFRAYVD